MDIIWSWWKEILSVALLYPLLWWNLKTNQKNIDRMFNDNTEWFKTVCNKIDNWFNQFLTVFKNHTTEDGINFKAIQKEISQSVGTTKLTNTQIIEIAKAKVWLASEKKLAFIRKRLEKNNLQERKEIVKTQIRTELVRRSEEYIGFLNGFITPVWLLGEWIEHNFPMDDFLAEVYDVMFRLQKDWDTEKEDINIKIDDIRFLMMAAQNTLWEKLKVDIK